MPRPWPSLAPRTMPAMSTKLTVAGHDLRALEHLAEHVEARVGHVDHADVRVDRRERIVRRQHVVLGQRVEQRRLPDVRQPDDPDRQTHASIVRYAAATCAIIAARYAVERRASVGGICRTPSVTISGMDIAAVLVALVTLAAGIGAGWALARNRAARRRSAAASAMPRPPTRPAAGRASAQLAERDRLAQRPAMPTLAAPRRREPGRSNLRHEARGAWRSTRRS